MLLDHFAASQSLPNLESATTAWNLSLPLTQRWHVLVGQEDQSVFMLTWASSEPRPPPCCWRASGQTAAPQLWCKVSVEHPGGDKDKVVLMASSVGSLSNGACRCLATWARADFGSDVY
jgi:hypothetical protein